MLREKTARAPRGTALYYVTSQSLSLSRMSHRLFPLHQSHPAAASATASGFKENVLVKCKALSIALACRIAINSALATPLLIYGLNSLSSSSTCLLGTCRGHHLQ